MNRTQIAECEDEVILCELSAEYCMGFIPTLTGWKTELNSNPKILNADKTVWGNYEDWQPTSPAEKGKAQCWELSVKYHCWTRLRNGKYVVFVNDKTEVEHQDPQITVVKAAIIAALNGEEL